MNDALLVCGFKRFGDLFGFRKYIDWYLPACDTFIEALAVDQFEYEELLPLSSSKP